MKYTLFFVTIALFLSCKEDKNTEAGPNLDTASEFAITKAITLLDNPSEKNSHLPRLFTDGNTLYLSWVTRKDSTDQLYYSALNNGNWQPPVLVSEGTDWFTNWADFPAIAANDHSILTSHLQKSANGTYTYDVMLNLLDKNLPSPQTSGANSKGVFTKQNFILHNDGTKSEHGFVSMLPYQDNSFFITWLDGRNTAGAEHDTHESHGMGGAMTLRSAVVPATGEIAQRTELDNRVCDCCQTSAAMTTNGPVVVYRDRSEDEVRDISIVRYVNGAWTKPTTLGEDNWKIAGCPVNGPSVDAFDNSLAVAWFTVSKVEGDVKVIFSDDAGATFSRPYRIDSGSATGRVDIVMLSKKEAAVMWMQPDGEDEALYLMKIDVHGYTGEPIVISKTSAARASGFPQLERVGDTLFVAWTDVLEKSKHINVAKLSASAL
ncbi:MAG: hypothetical protein CMC13_05980 [Flavobacteriaceae bacterium]|nr:hypothetical protein [Flavobacteriaceae bacterium]|tara:strand:+ start:39672 stop:40970 length:1299 start_codon:yes stop_codon:yes gene_type:complete